MKITEVDIDTIVPYARNPRKNDAAVTKVAASLEEFGWQQPIVVDEKNIVIVGHTRLKAAKKLGYTTAPVHIAVGLTPQQVKAYRLADNRTGEEAIWDEDLLRLELQEIEDLLSTGFDQDEIEELLNPNDDTHTDEDDVPLEPENPISREGDVWICGNHKVMCGDSCKPETYAALFGDEVADMVWTDPPYNVDYQSAGERKGYSSFGKPKLHKKIANDNMSDEQFYNFLFDAFTCCIDATKAGGCIYVAHSDMEGINFRNAMVNSGWYNKQLIIWVKNSPVLSRQDYNSAHEPILYGWKPGAGHYFSKDFTLTTVVEDRPDFTSMKKDELSNYLEGLLSQIETTVIDCNRPTKADLHPTMKPVKLVERMVENSCKAGQLVLDPFAGSGSTLIACEHLGRKARVIELSPTYVDVIVKRWMDHTQKEATLDGKTVAEVIKERL